MRPKRAHHFQLRPCDDTSIGVHYLAQLNQTAVAQGLETIRPHHPTPVDLAELLSSAFQPVFIGPPCTLPDNSCIVDIKLAAQPVHTEQAKLGHVVEVCHNKHARHIDRS